MSTASSHPGQRPLAGRVSLGVSLLFLAGCTNAEPGEADSSGSAGASQGAGSAAGVAGAATLPGAGSGSGGASANGGGPGGGVAGSAAGSGGAGGGSGGGAAGAGGATGSCTADSLLCEDFEAAAVGAIPAGWTAHGEASVAEDQANRGRHSLKMSPANNGGRRIYHPTNMLGARHWGRVYFRVQLPVPEAFVHSTMVTFFGKGPTVGDAEFRMVDTVKDAKSGGFAAGKYQFLYNVQPSGAEFATGSDYDYTFDDKWHCTEWHVDAADQSYSFFYDGVEAVSFSKGAGNYKGSELPTSFEEVRLGWNNYQSAPPGFTAWLDDFAIDDQRVGCLP